MAADRLLSSYNYFLPEELIAQTPAVPRDSSRLLVVESPTTHHHSCFKDLREWLRPGDLLILNNTRVIPARLYGNKSTGAPVEVLLLQEEADNIWLALVKPGKRFKLGTEIIFTPQQENEENLFLKAKVIERDVATGGRKLQFYFPSQYNFTEILAKFGHLPLPPYITSEASQPGQYQTVYAQQPGAVAAPTAGLHFTEELLQSLTDDGIKQAYLTLHVGVGTFRPVEVEDVTTHKMHQEWVEVPPVTIEAIKETKTRGGRIIAVGTTVVRALEGAAAETETSIIEPFCGQTDLFIYPGYSFKVVEGIITNFHLPGSSLLMLVAALIGRDRLFTLYEEAIAEQYRFYSFGDAMLILPEAVI
ncbi:MAG: tRNA preQ1(34) S-adenosylmethionine ribosyltransferase-isomerase QueA [Spirulinaceae cyanobacterium]